MFQSTPPRGGRRVEQPDEDDDICFNPRPHAGGDLADAYAVQEMAVSIHAPTRGATSGKYYTCWLRVFQSTPPRGGRPRGIRLSSITKVFQSTPPRGGRRCMPVVWRMIFPFQSTPPRGGRPSTPNASFRTPWFQSTPPRGGRLCKSPRRGYL